MSVEIDQSGKIENTSVITILAFSNNKNGYIYMKPLCKRRLRNYFSERKKTRVFIYKTFAALLYVMVIRYKLRGDINIDIEYPGNMNLIKSYLYRIFKKFGFHSENIDLYFVYVGKRSRAHCLAIHEYRAKKHIRENEVTFKEVVEILDKI